MTPKQIKAARAVLGWKQHTLAEAAGLSVEGIRNLEKADSLDNARVSTERALKGAIERAGITVIENQDETFGLLWGEVRGA